LTRKQAVTGDVMKNINRMFFTLISLFVTTQALAVSNLPGSTISEPDQPIIKTHNAIKSVSLRIQLDENLHGFVESKNCSFCKTIRITITPDTKAYANNIKVPLIQAKNRIGQFATIVYELKTKNVSAIRW